MLQTVMFVLDNSSTAINCDHNSQTLSRSRYQIQVMLYKEILEAYKRAARTLHGICLAGSKKFGVISSLRDTPSFSEYRLNEMPIGGELRLNDSILSSFLSLHFMPPDEPPNRAKTIICFVSSPHDINCEGKSTKILQKRFEEEVIIIFILLDDEYDEELKTYLKNVCEDDNQCTFYVYKGQDPRAFAQRIVSGTDDDGYIPPIYNAPDISDMDEELRQAIEKSKSEY